MNKKLVIYLAIGLIIGLAIQEARIYKNKSKSNLEISTLKELESKNSQRIEDLERREKDVQRNNNKFEGLTNEVERLSTLVEVQEEELKIYRKKPYTKNKPKLIEKSTLKE